MPDAVPGLGIRRCPWVKTNRESQRRKMTHAQALDWLVIVSRTVGDEGCNYKAWHLVQLKWPCVESSASGSYCDLQAEEFALLELLREDYASAKHILDAPMVSWPLECCFSLVRATPFKTEDVEKFRGSITPASSVAPRLQSIFRSCVLSLDSLGGAATTTAADLLHAHQQLGAMVLLPSMCQSLTTRQTVICTPLHYALQVGITPEKKLPSEPVAPPQPSDDELGHTEDEDEHFFRYPVHVVLRCLQLFILLKSADNISKVVRLATAFCMTPYEHSIFGQVRCQGNPVAKLCNNLASRSEA